MHCILLGTGGYHPNERRHTASIMLPEQGIVLDAGTSFFRVPTRLKTDKLKIFLTHAHLDHICGLTYPLVAMLTGNLKHVEVYGEAHKLAMIKQHLFAEEIFPVLPNFEFKELVAGEFVPVSNGGSLIAYPLKHPGGSLGFRLDWPGHSLSYITDTTVDGSYDAFIQNANLLIHECYFPDDQAAWAEKTGHSHISSVLKLAARTNVKQLVLTHIDPQQTNVDPVGLEFTRHIFPGTILGEDLMELEF